MAMTKLALPALLLLLSTAAHAGTHGGRAPGGVAAGTLIETPDGAKPIETLAPGGLVYSYSAGQRRSARIQKVFAASAPLLLIKAGDKVLCAAAEHPLLTRRGFAPAGTLKAGAEAAVLAGRDLLWPEVTSAETAEGTQAVYNLEVAPPHNFIAGGFVVHNYSGYSARARRRELREQYGTDSPTWDMLSSSDKAGTLIVGAIVLFLLVSKLYGGGGDQY